MLKFLYCSVIVRPSGTGYRVQPIFIAAPMRHLPYDTQQQAETQQLYVADVYAACRTLQGCSDVLTAGLRAIHQQATAVQQLPRGGVRASFADAVKYFSAQHGPTDSMILRNQEAVHRREEGERNNCCYTTLLQRHIPEQAIV